MTERAWLSVRYVCGECGLDEVMTVPETTNHWRLCLLPKMQKKSEDS